MPCAEGDSITNEEINLFLSILKTHSLTDHQVAQALNLPLFKVRSKLRELKRLGYVVENNGEYLKK